MNYANIKFMDIANGPGVRTSLFVSGCRNHCPGCFNEQAQDFDYGKHFTEAVEDIIIDSCRPYFVSGLSILGGEPFDPANVSAVCHFVSRFRQELGSKSIWVYSGYTYESLKSCQDDTFNLLRMIDVLVDGPFIESKKDISLRFRGSSNQRIINMPVTNALNEVVLWRDDPLFAEHRL